MVRRGFVVVILSMGLLVAVFLIAGLAASILTESFERATLIGGLCGFAAAWLTRTTYLLGQRIEGETRSEGGNGEGAPDESTNRQDG